MAHKTGGGSTRKNRDSISKRLGVKLFGGQKAQPGSIIIRQKGNKFYPGIGAKQGNDFTIYSIATGKVGFTLRRARKLVNVI